jgi:ADP-heptose:LPS heptosyltransferase
MERILVIKLGALGDFVQATGPFAAIRAHHPNAHITLLTTRPFVDLALQSPWFDEIWQDEKPRGISGWLALRKRLRAGKFLRVYDLQTSDRSSWYFQILLPGRRPEWSGIAWGCSHPHANSSRDFMHTIERQAEQLAMAGIAETPLPDISWANADISRFALGQVYALLVPGGSAHRPAKRWPVENFSRLALELAKRGMTPVLLGGAAESVILDEIAKASPAAHNLCGETSLVELAALAKGAKLAIGNDTGPMHVMAVAGAPSLVLYSNESDPALCAQRGEKTRILRKPSLADLSVDEVLGELT